MRWTERQRAMLHEMGVRLWLPGDRAAGEGADVAPRAEAASIAGAATLRAAEAVAEAAPRAAPVATAEARTEPRPAPPAEERSRLPGLAAADWLVVGEPLDPADPQQQQLLEAMLRAIGVGLVAPSRERRAVFVELGALLGAALDAVAPRCIVALGRTAAATLLGADAPLGGLRGRVHAYAGVPVVVTFPPAFLLRNAAEKAKAWADLCLAVGAIAEPADPAD